MKTDLRSRVLIIAATALLFAGGSIDASPASISHAAPGLRVLHVNSYHPGYFWSDQISAGLHQTLHSTYGERLALHVEYLDGKRHSRELQTTLGNAIISGWTIKYAKERFDLLIATDQDAYNLLQRCRHRLFPGVPLVYSSVENPGPDTPDSVGITDDSDYPGNIALILRLFPETKRIWVLADTSSTGLISRSRIEALRPMFPRTEFHLFNIPPTLPTESILARAASLQSGEVIFFAGYFSDQGSIVPSLSAIAPVPVFSYTDEHLSEGALGGKVRSAIVQGHQLAGLAIRILNGTPPDRIADQKEKTVPTFEHSQLRRFGIAESSLPAGSILRNRPPSFLEGFRLYALLGGAFILLETALIFWLITLTRKQRRLRLAAQESTQRFQLFFETVPFSCVVHDLNRRILMTNKAFLASNGMTLEQVIGRTDAEIGIQFDSKASDDITAMILNHGSVNNHEAEIIAPDGEKRNILFSAHLISMDGKPAIFSASIDITSRKRAEEELRQTEHRFRQLFDFSPIPMAAISLSGAAIEVNRRFHETLGYTVENLERIDDWWTHAYPDATYREKVQSQWLSMVEQSQKTSAPTPPMEVEVTDQFGKTHIMIITSVVLDTIILTSFYDVTEMKRSQAALLESERRYKQAIFATSDAVWEWDLRTNEAFFSPRWYEMLGYENGELPMNFETWKILCHPEDMQQTMDTIQATLNAPQSNGYTAEFRMRHKDGSWRWILGRGNVTARNDRGVPSIFSGTHTDITERKQAEEALLSLTQRLNDIIEFMPDATFVLDRDKKIIAWNRAAEEMTGYKKEELLGKGDYEYAIPFFGERHPILIDLLDKSDQEIETFYKHVHRINEKIYAESFIQRLNNGLGAHLWGAAAPLFDKDGNRFGSIEVIKDVTELKQAEEEKDRLQSQLAQAQKIESIGRLAGGVAHDFNNMLGVILGYTELALERLKPDEKLYHQISEIQRAAERSADLTRQLLAFARQQPANPKVLNLNDTVSGMLKLLQRLIGEDIGLIWNPAPDLWLLNIDPTQIDQVLANLCVNARDAITGNGRISISTANVSVDAAYSSAVSGSIPGEYVTLSVEDNGCGMDRETQSRIFEPFFTTKGLGAGTGLGLATVYGIVNQNHGFINVYSEPGKGSSFRIYFPRHAGTVSNMEQSIHENAPKSRGETILLVEDDPSMLATTSAMLEELGYRFLAAGSADAAIRITTDHIKEINLVLTDVIMPEINGRELHQRIREIIPGIPCLYMSGYTANIISTHGVLDEGTHFIQKPFSLKDLGIKIRETLDSAASQ